MNKRLIYILVILSLSFLFLCSCSGNDSPDNVAIASSSYSIDDDIQLLETQVRLLEKENEDLTLKCLIMYGFFAFVNVGFILWKISTAEKKSKQQSRCPKCGSKIEEDMKSCPYCGADVQNN